MRASRKRYWILKSIGVASIFKMFGGTFFQFGLIVGLILSLVFPEELYLPIIGTIPSGIIGAFLYAVFWGLAVGLIAGLLGAIYNIFALLFGGIVLAVEEKEMRE